MTNQGASISWRNLSNKYWKQFWCRDALLYIRVSVLTRTLLKRGLKVSDVYYILQDLGMNVYEEHIQLILDRTNQHK